MTNQEPKLLAEFKLDAEGRPQTYSGSRHKHYKIRLSLKNAPPETLSVAYQLHESYKDRVREIPIGVPDFREDISSYGDYLVTVTLQGARSAQALTAKLSDALKENYRGVADPEILNAIDEIENH